MEFEIKKKQLAVINDNFVQLLVGTVAGTATTVGLMWSFADPAALFIWAAVIWALAILRTFVFLRHTRTELTPERIDPIARQMVVFAGLAGALWGLGGVVFLDLQEFTTATILALILAGMAAGCVATYSAYRAIYTAFAVPAVVPFVIYTLLSAQWGFQVVGLALAIFLLINLSYSRSIQSLMRESLELRHENDALILDLEDKRAQAEEANTAKSRFLAAASHDLRQPLHALGLFHAALERRYADANQTIFNRMADARTMLLALFNGLLDMSALQAGSVKPVIGTHDLVEIVAAEIGQSIIPDHGRTAMDWRAPDTPVLVRTDPELLARVIRNILSNALKFTKEGAVTIDIEPGEGFSALLIKDSGPGIDGALLPNIFEEYEQVGETDRRKGVGLGLAIVRELSQILDVSVTVASTVGVGTEFRLEIPLGDADPGTRSKTRPSPIADLPTGLVAVALDDDAAVLEGLGFLLSEWGITVILGADYQTVVAGLQKRDLVPDIVVTDYHLSDTVTGPNVHALLCDEFAQDLPLVLISGQSNLDTLVADIPANSRVLAKPVEEMAVFAAVAELTKPG